MKVRSQQLQFAEIWYVEVKKLSAWSVYFVLGIDEFSLMGTNFERGENGDTVAANLEKNASL